jgi:hypothetical protein
MEEEKLVLEQTVDLVVEKTITPSGKITLTTKSRRRKPFTEEEEKEILQKTHNLNDVFLAHFTKRISYCLCEAPHNPEWQFQHRQLYYGYRTCDTFYEAFMSLFYFHNEFVNIWLHYIGTILLLWKTYSYYSFYAPQMMNAPTEYQYDFYLLFICVLMGNSFPILTSGLCHHFYCVSQYLHRLCWYLDFMGMLSGINFVTANFLYLTFYCEIHPNHSVDSTTNLPIVQGNNSSEAVIPVLFNQYTTYHTIITILIGGYFIAMYFCWGKYHLRLRKEELLPKDRFPEFSQTLSLYSIFAYLISILSTVYFHPEYLADSILSNILIQSGLYPLAMAMGIVVFAQGSIPERFHGLFGVSKHFFDFVGHSHQLWHIVSLVVLYFWMDVIFAHYEVRYHMTCSASKLQF